MQHVYQFLFISLCCLLSFNTKLQQLLTHNSQSKCWCQLFDFNSLIKQQHSVSYFNQTSLCTLTYFSGSREQNAQSLQTDAGEEFGHAVNIWRSLILQTESVGLHYPLQHVPDSTADQSQLFQGSTAQEILAEFRKRETCVKIRLETCLRKLRHHQSMREADWSEDRDRTGCKIHFDLV